MHIAETGGKSGLYVPDLRGRLIFNECMHIHVHMHIEHFGIYISKLRTGFNYIECGGALS